MRKVIFYILFFVLIVLFLAACTVAADEVSGGITPGETTALAGFIEIRDNSLYITPVEVFAIYRAGTGREAPGFDSDVVFRSIELVEINDIDRMTEFGISADSFTSRYYIRPNWSADKGWYYVEQADIDTLVFELTDETTYTFVDFHLLFIDRFSSDRQYTTKDVTEFLEYLYPTVIHFIEVYDGKVISLFQDFAFTM